MRTIAKLVLSICLLTLVHATYAQITEESVKKAFKQNKELIDGEGQDCYVVKFISGDLNRDGKTDVLVQYNCGAKGSMGNASVGSGWAIWISFEESPLMIINDTEKNWIIPEKILSDGTIIAEQRKHAKGDMPNWPSIKIPKKYQLGMSSLIEIK